MMQLHSIKISPSSRRSFNNPNFLDDDDPFAQVLRPPPGETREEMAMRIAAEQDAIRISNEIDARLQDERKALEWRQKACKVLLLGQSESGKSTVLKNFQLLYSPKHFHAERQAWRAVIQLNLIKSVTRLWDLIDSELSPIPSHDYTRSPLQNAFSPKLPVDLQRLRLKLSPLQTMRDPLIRQLNLCPPNSRGDENEHWVQSGADWQTFFMNVLGLGFGRTSKDGGRPNLARQGSQQRKRSDPTSNVLNACCEDLVALWTSPDIQKMLGENKRLRLMNSPGFFLPDAERITALDYEPTDDDILRARLRTLGVREHIFKVSDLGSGGLPFLGKQDWILYDVGGSRHQRDRWSAYFEHVNAIIFLAPISAFDEVLEEETSVNRLIDSMQIWKSICANRLLANATIILFLNKMDLLEAKIASGIRIGEYIKTYEDRPNDAPSFTRYLKGAFKQELGRHSPKPRPFVCYETAAINHSLTSNIIEGVRDSIMRNHFESTGVI